MTDDHALRTAELNEPDAAQSDTEREPADDRLSGTEPESADDRGPGTERAPGTGRDSAGPLSPAGPSASAAVKAPRRWLGRHGGWWILLIGGGILAGYLTYDALVLPGVTNYRSLPVISLELGGILAATALFYTMLFRVRPGDSVTIPRLFAALGIGAFVTTFLASVTEGQLDRWIYRLPAIVHAGQTTTTLTLFAGPVEETLKGLTVLVLGIGIRTKTLRGGLFLGGAVGLGFAAVEDLEYFVRGWEFPMQNLGQVGSIALVIGLRTVLTPLMHPIFTALIGGMLFAASRNGRYRLSVPLVGTFFAIAGVHSLWDSLVVAVESLRGSIPITALGLLILLAFAIMLGIAIGLPFVWRAVATRAAIQAGIRLPKPPRLVQTMRLPQDPPPPAGWIAPAALPQAPNPPAGWIAPAELPQGPPPPAGWTPPVALPVRADEPTP